MLVTALYLILSLILGGMVFVVLVFLILSREDGLRQDRAIELGSRFGTEQVKRANEKSRLLWYIGAPECPDGRYSPNQMALWRRYNQLDAEDKAWTEWERSQIVETRGYS